MQCPKCGSANINKNGKQNGKQNHIHKECGRQFYDTYTPPTGYSDEFKQEYLKMYVNGLGFRTIERVKGVPHTTVITWVKQMGELLPDTYTPVTIPEVGELDELETFVGSKKNKIWLWTAVDHFKQGILGWVLGDHSAEIFKHLWTIVATWCYYFYVIDDWPVYPKGHLYLFAPDQNLIARMPIFWRTKDGGCAPATADFGFIEVS